MTTGKKLRQLAMGSRLALNGVEWTVESIEPQFGRLRLAHEDGRVDERSIRWLVHHPDVRPLGARQPEQRQQSAGQMRSQEDLTDIQLQRAMIRAEHVREAATGFRDGHPSRARPREPRSAYDPDRTTLTQRRQAKIDELSAIPLHEAELLGLKGLGLRTLQGLTALEGESLLLACADGRWTRRRGGHPSITLEIREAIFAVKRGVRAARPHRSAVSPVLANLFMHYALDMWLDREFPAVTFERYADDAVVHCVSERQARQVLAALTDRMGEVELSLHPDKTRIVYCRDGKRQGSYEHREFTFLGYTFRARKSQDKQGRRFLSFEPAISKDALKRIGREVRSWRLHRRSDLSFVELARRINPIVAGWINYYGRFYRSALIPLLQRINAYLVRWVRKKYRRLSALRKALGKMGEIAKRYPRMFAQWKVTTAASSGW